MQQLILVLCSFAEWAGIPKQISGGRSGPVTAEVDLRTSFPPNILRLNLPKTLPQVLPPIAKEGPGGHALSQQEGCHDASN